MKFKKGHHYSPKTEFKKGHVMSEEVRRKISKSLKGRKKSPFSQEHRKNLSLSLKGHIAWNKGKHVQTNTGRTHFKKGQIPWNKGKTGLSIGWPKGKSRSKESVERQNISWMRTFVSNPKVREKMIASHKGKSAWWNIGRKRTEEMRKRMSLAQKERFSHNPSPRKGKHLTEETIKKLRKALKGRSVWNKGLSPKTDERVRRNMEKGLIRFWKTHPDYQTGEKSHFWKGGISFEPYSPDWTRVLRKVIRERDHYICQACGKKGLDVHHINYDKKNCSPENLITLCRKCHAKTSYNRNYWFAYFCYQLGIEPEELL